MKAVVRAQAEMKELDESVRGIELFSILAFHTLKRAVPTLTPADVETHLEPDEMKDLVDAIKKANDGVLAIADGGSGNADSAD